MDVGCTPRPSKFKSSQFDFKEELSLIYIVFRFENLQQLLQLNSLRASSKVCYILLGKSQDLPTLKTIYQVKNSSISIICYFGLGKIKKGNRQHASREKTLFLWSVRSMQAGRGFAKPFPKLPYMHGEGEFLPSCHILPSRLPNCWMSVLSISVKN